MKIGIMTAMDQEYEMARKVLSNSSRHEIIPVHCGWGKVNSAVNAYKLISEHHPDCIISTGCAGGISKDVHLLDVVVAAQVAYHDCWYGEPNEYGQVQGFPARFEAHPTLLAAARSLEDDCGAGLRTGNARTGFPLRDTDGPFASRGGIKRIQEREKFEAGSVIPLEFAPHTVKIRSLRAALHLRLHHTDGIRMLSRAGKQGEQREYDSEPSHLLSKGFQMIPSCS